MRGFRLLIMRSFQPVGLMQEILHSAHQRLDERHWWFVARRRIVLDLLRREFDGTRPRILDIGCGGGGNLRALADLGAAFGVDPEPTSVEVARLRSGCDARLGRLPDEIPFEEAGFDLVTLLDVLEHVENDAAALATVTRLLRPGGICMLTVPAYMFLWSEHDVLNEHKRRYTRSSLRTVIEGAGLRVRKITYYNSVLFAPVALVRLLRGHRRGGSDLKEVSPVLNALLRHVFAAERFWLRHAGFPAGVSVLALAEKTADPGRTEPDA